MDKNKIKDIIAESLHRHLTEGAVNRDTIDKWDQIRSILGADKMVDEIFNYMDSNEIEDFIEHIDRYYEIF